MLTAFVVFTIVLLVPSGVAQLWAAYEIRRRNFKAKHQSSDWLLVGYIAYTVMALLSVSAMMPQFGIMPLLAFFASFCVNFTALKNAEHRIGRAEERDNGRRVVAAIR